MRLLLILYFLMIATEAYSHIEANVAVNNAALIVASNNSQRRSYDHNRRRNYYDDMYMDYFNSVNCDEDGNVKQVWASGASVVVDIGYCRELLEVICVGSPFKPGGEISQAQFNALNHFYPIGKNITAAEVNSLCKKNKRILK